MNRKAAEEAEQLRKHWTGPMSEAELAFLRDVQGFIEFAIRNGLSYPMVMGSLVHDFNEIAHAGFDFGKALSRGFVPKVSGYSEMTGEEFGDDDEAGPSS